MDQNWYEIHPFSYSFDGSDNDVNFSDFSKTWYDYATSANLIKTNAVTKEIKLNIVGTFKNYDSNNFIADQAALNQWLGLSNDNSYFNGLFTNQNLPTDLEWNYGLINTNGNISINAVSHFANKSLSVDYVGFEKSIIQRLIKIALQIGIVIYILLFVALIVSLSFVIKMFVYQFKQFILVLRATGYSFKTINWVILVQLVSDGFNWLSCWFSLESRRNWNRCGSLKSQIRKYNSNWNRNIITTDYSWIINYYVRSNLLSYHAKH
jgi:hypothetical protein